MLNNNDKWLRYRKTFSQIQNSLNFFDKVDNDDEMKKFSYVDEFTTKEQKERDKKITELLSEYVDAYKYKNKSNKRYKAILLGVCEVILLAFSSVFIYFVLKINGANQVQSTETVIQLISVCVTFLTLIVGILTIITKYAFPENEEEYITRIVEIIQKNDLDNKKENIKAKVKIEKSNRENENNFFEEISN